MRTPDQLRDFEPTVYGDVPTVPAPLLASSRRPSPLRGMSHTNRQAAFPEEPEAANANRLQQRRLALERDIAVFGERSRSAEQVRAAYGNGEIAGARSGYVSGMQWGLTVGAACGAAGAATLIGLYRIAAPALAAWLA